MGSRRVPSECGAVAGCVAALEHSLRAERNLPILHTFDRFGHRLDEVELDPSWHWLLGGAIERGMAGLPWREQAGGAHVVRAALFVLWSQVNDGVMCPVSMTYAAVPAIRDGAPALAAEWEPRLTSSDYDSRRARRHGDDRTPGRLRRPREHHPRGPASAATPTSCTATSGSAPTRRATSSSCSRRRPAVCPASSSSAGRGMEFQRLKDKLGGRSLRPPRSSSAESSARLVGEEGRGVPAIIGWSTTRGSIACSERPPVPARGVTQAIHHAPSPQRLRRAAVSTSRRCAMSSPISRSTPRPRPPA